MLQTSSGFLATLHRLPSGPVVTSEGHLHGPWNSWKDVAANADEEGHAPATRATIRVVIARHGAASRCLPMGQKYGGGQTSAQRQRARVVGRRTLAIENPAITTPAPPPRS